MIGTYFWWKIQIFLFPNCSGFFHGQNICLNPFLNNNFITKIPLIIIEEQKNVFKNLSKSEEIFLTLGQIF